MIDIKRKDGTVRVSVEFSDSSLYRKELMVEEYVMLNFSTDSIVRFSKGDYIETEFGRFDIVTINKPKENRSTGGYDYEQRFGGFMEKLKTRMLFYDRQNNKECTWKLTQKPSAFLDIICSNIKALGWGQYSYSVDASLTEMKNINFDSTSILDALTAIAEAWGVEWWIDDDMTIHLSKCEHGETVILSMDSEVVDMDRSEGSSSYATRLYAFGSTRNIPTNYRGASSGSTIQGVVEKRLKLPEGIDYVDAWENMSDEDVVETVVNFDEIYPKRIGSIAELSTKQYTETVENTDGNSTTETWNAYRFKDSGITFSKDYIIPGQELRIVFQTGALAGMDFAVSFEPNTDGASGAGTQVWEIVRNDDFGINLPSDSLKPQVGDTYVLYGFDIALVASTYVPAAEQELLTAARARIQKICIENATYTCNTNPIKCAGYVENAKGDLDYAAGNIVDLGVGQKVTLVNDNQFGSNGFSSRVFAVEKLLCNKFSCKYSVGGTAKYSRLADIENKAADANDSADKNKEEIRSSKKKLIDFTNRRFRDLQETTRLLEQSLLNFSGSINPMSVKAMQLLVGDESLQFRFVDSKTSPKVVVHNVTFNNTTKRLFAPKGILQHLTIGIKNISPAHAANEYRYWDMAEFTSSYLTDGSKPYYLYAEVDKVNGNGVFVLSEASVGMDDISGKYYLLVGILNSEFEGERSFVTLYGYSEILPGRITTEKIVSPSGNTFFDLVNDIIQGKITFTAGSSGLYNLVEWANERQQIDDALAASKDAVAQNLGYNNFAELNDKAIAGETIVEGGRLRNTLVDTDALFAREISAKNMTVLGGKVGDFEVRSKLVGSGYTGGVANGNQIILDPSNNEIVMAKNGVKKVRLTNETLTPLAELKKDGGTLFCSSGSASPVKKTSVLALYASRNDVGVGGVGLSRNNAIGRLSGIPKVYNTIEATGKITLQPAFYSFDVPYVVNIVHSGDSTDGRYNRITGTNTCKVEVRLVGPAGVISTYKDEFKMSVDSGDSGNSYSFNRMARFNFSVATAAQFWLETTISIIGGENPIAYQSYNHATTFRHSWWSTQNDWDVQYELSVAPGMSIDGSIGLTELSSSGFQSVWTDHRFIRIDGNVNNTTFIESEGKWVHNGVEVKFDTNTITGYIDPTRFASRDYIDSGFYTRSASDGRYLGISAQAADSAKLGGQLPSYYSLATHTHTISQITDIANASVANADKLDGFHASQLNFYQSSRDFADGTFIQSNIDYSTTNGEPFLLEIEGNSYGSYVPFDIKVQGYIYSDTIINKGGVSNGTSLTGLVAFNYGGKLCFWFPRQAYWQGFSVFINDSHGGVKENRFVSISNSVKPTDITKEVSFSIAQSYHSDNFNKSDVSVTGSTLTAAAGAIVIKGSDYPQIQFMKLDGSYRLLFRAGDNLRWRYDGINDATIYHSANLNRSDIPFTAQSLAIGGGTTVIDSSRNITGVNGTFSGSLKTSAIQALNDGDSGFYAYNGAGTTLKGGYRVNGSSVGVLHANAGMCIRPNGDGSTSNQLYLPTSGAMSRDGNTVWDASNSNKIDVSWNASSFNLLANNKITTTGGYLTAISNGNELCVGAEGSTNMYVNYRIPQGLTTVPSTWHWKAGSSTTWASHQMGALIVNGDAIVSGRVIATTGESRFASSSYTDPASGFTYAIKVGNGGIAVNGDSLFNNNIATKGYIGSAAYTSGYLGAGTRWDIVNSYFEVDNLTIRNALRAHIFQKDVVKATNGYWFISDVSEIVAQSTTADATKFIYVKEQNFQNGDLLWYKDVADDGSTIAGIKITITDAGTSVTLPNSAKAGYRYTYTVYAGSGQFKAGGTIVRVGGASGRQGSIYFDASSANAPYMDIYDGVATWADFQSAAKTKVRQGKLDGITDATFGALTGYGLYGQNVYLTGAINAISGKIATSNINSTGITSAATNGWTSIVGADYPRFTLNDGVMNRMNLYYANAGDYGFYYRSDANNYLFRLGNVAGVTSHIASWNFNTTQLYQGTALADKTLGTTDGQMTIGNGYISAKNWYVGRDGSASLAKGNITWDATGAVTFSDNVKLQWQTDIAAVSVGGVNLIENADFSRYRTDYNPGWDTTKNGTLTLTYFASSGYNSGAANAATCYHAHLYDINGTKVLRYVNTGTESWLGISMGSVSSKLVAGKEYTISMDVYGVSGTPRLYGGLYFRRIGDSATSFYAGYYYFTPTIGNWTRCSWTFTLPSNFDKTFSASLYSYANTGSTYIGEAYVKNIQLEQGNKATDFKLASEDIISRLTRIGYDGIYTGTLTATNIQGGTLTVGGTAASKIGDLYVRDASNNVIAQFGSSNIVSSWNFTTNRLWNGTGIYNASSTNGLELGTSAGYARMLVYAGSNYVQMFQNGANYGINAVNGGVDTFKLGSTNFISSWNFDATKLYQGTALADKTLGTVDGQMTIGNGYISAKNWYVGRDGSASLAKGNITWDAAGAVTLSDAVKLIWRSDVSTNVIGSKFTKIDQYGVYTGEVRAEKIIGDTISGKSIIGKDKNNVDAILLDGKNGVLTTYRSDGIGTAMKLSRGELTFVNDSNLPTLFLRNTNVTLPEIMQSNSFAVASTGSVNYDTTYNGTEFSIATAGTYTGSVSVGLYLNVAYLNDGQFHDANVSGTVICNLYLDKKNADGSWTSKGVVGYIGHNVTQFGYNIYYNSSKTMSVSFTVNDTGTYRYRVYCNADSYIIINDGSGMNDMQPADDFGASVNVAGFTTSLVQNGMFVGINGFTAYNGGTSRFVSVDINDPTVLKIKGKTDIPGVLLSGKINRNGTADSAKLWGANSANTTTRKVSDGVFEITHNLGRTNYTCIPQFSDSEAFWACTIRTISELSNTCTVEMRNGVGGMINYGFSFMLLGHNY